MADESNIVIRWEINNAYAKFATGRAESEEFHEGGFKWTVAVKRCLGIPRDVIEFSLRCDAEHDGFWECEVEVDVRVLHENRSFDCDWVEKKRLLLNANECVWLNMSVFGWHHFTSTDYNINDTVIIEYIIRIVSSKSAISVAKFASPSEMNNVTLEIEGNKLKVSRDYLAILSPVFSAMFFGDFAEKGKDEVEIKDVVYQEFVDLLHVIFLEMEITYRTVPHILKLADRFQMENVIKQSKKHLTRTKGISLVKKLLLADQYRLVSLRDQFLQSFTSPADLNAELLSSPECLEFSDEMKIAICDRLVQINLR